MIACHAGLLAVQNYSTGEEHNFLYDCSEGWSCVLCILEFASPLTDERREPAAG
jgi:hypothetical protein